MPGFTCRSHRLEGAIARLIRRLTIPYSLSPIPCNNLSPARLQQFHCFHTAFVSDCGSAAANRDHLADNRNRNLFGSNGTDVESNRSIDPSELFRRDALILQLLVDGDYLTL